MLLRRGDESRAARGILPDRRDVSRKALSGGGRLERRVYRRAFFRRSSVEGRVGKHGQDGRATNVQMRRGDRII